MAFTHDPDDTCPFNDHVSYNTAMRQVYGAAFEPVTDKQFQDLRAQSSCPSSVSAAQLNGTDVINTQAPPRPDVPPPRPRPRPRPRPDATGQFVSSGTPTTATGARPRPRAQTEELTTYPVVRAPMSTAQKVTTGAAIVAAVGTLVILGVVLLRRK